MATTKKETTTKKKKVKKIGPIARNEELEEQIARAPDDAGTYLVYADWLQQRGDPRGELITVQHELSLDSTVGEEWARLKVRELQLLEEEYPDHFYGPLVRWRISRRRALDWRYGFIRFVRHEDLSSDVTAAKELFNHHASGRFIESYVGDCLDSIYPSLKNEEPDPAATAVMTKNIASCMRRLSSRGTYSKSRASLPWRLPSLERFHGGRLQATTQADAEIITTTAHKSLKQLHFDSPDALLLSSLIKAKAKTQLPALEHVSFTNVTETNLRKAVETLTALQPKRVRFGISSACGDGDGVVAAIRDAARFIDVLHLDAPTSPLLAAMKTKDIELARATKVEVSAVPHDQTRDTFFDRFPTLPNVRSLALPYPGDLVRYFRNLAQSTIAKQIEELKVYVGKPAAGKVLVEKEFPKLTHLKILFDGMLSPEYLQSASILASNAIANVRSLHLTPAHLPSLATSPLAKMLEKLSVVIDNDIDAQFLFKTVTTKSFPALTTLRIEGGRVLDAKSFTSLGKLPWKLEWPSVERDDSF